MVSGANGPLSNRQFRIVVVMHDSTSRWPAPERPDDDTSTSSTRPEGVTVTSTSIVPLRPGFKRSPSVS